MEEISVQNCPSLSVRQVGALAEAGFRRLWDLAQEKHKQRIMQAASLSIPNYEKLVNDVTELLRPGPFFGSSYSFTKQRTVRSTGIPGFAETVGGGLFDGDLMEFYGGIGTGKSQLAMFICSEYLKGDEAVAYFDLKGNFIPKRLLQLCDGERELLRNLEVIQPTNIVETMEVARDLEKKIGERNEHEFYKKLKLIVFDSVPMVIYPAVDVDPESWRYLHRQLYEACSRISHLNGGITVLFINHETTLRPISKMGPRSQAQRKLSTTPTTRAAMGTTFWSHTCNFRFRLTKDPVNKELIKVTVEKSTRGESSRSEGSRQFQFRIQEEGIEFG